MRLIARLAAAAALVAASVTAAAADDHLTIRIATEGAYPPFNTTEADGTLSGFDVDIANALCAEMKADCTIVAQDWDGIIPGLVAGKYDAIVASMSITDERLETIDFTDRYYSNYLRVVAPADSTVSTLEDLKSLNVGAQRATIAAQWLEEYLGRRGDPRLYDTQTAAYADLQAGRLDALVSDVYPAYDWLQENEGYAFVAERIDIDDQIAIGVRKGEDELKSALNEALKAIRENGTYAEINAKYFPFDIY